MDREPLVEGGADGLAKMAELFRERGLPVEGLYLVGRSDGEGFDDWRIVAALDPFAPGSERAFIDEVVDLRRRGLLPRIDGDVSFTAVSSDHPEAERVLDYVRQMSRSGRVQRDVVWRGMARDYVLAIDCGRRLLDAA